MPKSRFLPNYGAVVDSNKITYDESNVDNPDKNTYKYLPFCKYPLKLYLDYMKMALQSGTWSKKEIILPINTPLQPLELHPNTNLLLQKCNHLQL